MDLKQFIYRIDLQMARKALHLVLVLAMLGAGFFTASQANAGLSEMRSGLATAAGDLETDQTAPQIVGNLINAVLSLIGVLLLVYLIYAGFLWMTAGGDETKVKKATAMIRNSVIGILIITLSFVLANAVLDALLQGLGGGATGGE